MADLFVDFVYMWVRELRGAKSVSFADELLGDFSEVGRHVRDVTQGNVVFCGGVQDFSEQGLSRAAGGR